MSHRQSHNASAAAAAAATNPVGNSNSSSNSNSNKSHHHHHHHHRNNPSVALCLCCSEVSLLHFTHPSARVTVSSRRSTQDCSLHYSVAAAGKNEKPAGRRPALSHPPPSPAALAVMTTLPSL